ncbi:hypothetical protein AAKU55_001902 [Oxalobacteraceae bacterium GrIS 1.11]
MSKLSTLEKEILSLILSSFVLEKENVNFILEVLKVKDRIFSGLERGFCSGFYTHFEDNVALRNLNKAPHEFSVQAKCDRLEVGEMGFLVFCDATTKSLLVMEGFLYGDDRISVDELLKDEHTFSVYALPGM